MLKSSVPKLRGQAVLAALFAAVLFTAVLSASGCGSGSGGGSEPPADDPGAQDPPPVSTAGKIHLNQLGFLPGGHKLAVVPDVPADSFTILEAANGTPVYSGALGAAREWPPANERARLADFSDFSTPGSYLLRVEGVEDSAAFAIDAGAYAALNDAALKAFYFNRASTELLPQHAGQYARPMGHPDLAVAIHESANPHIAGHQVPAPKGWYDAGDFGKYVVNSGISTYTLLAAYEHFPDYYAGRDLNIPESGNGRPDILDEVLWNLEWMLEMQDSDGGVFHKLTTLGFAGAVMPHEGSAQRYMIGKGTAASLNFAATMAAASRIYAPFDGGLSERMLSAAESAWRWARENPARAFKNPADVHTGEYGDPGPFADEFAWAAAELYITSGQPAYYSAFEEQGVDNAVPFWADSRGLAWMSLAFHRDALGVEADTGAIARQILGLADSLAAQAGESAYRVALRSGDFNWGSNGGALNRAMMLLQGYRLQPEARYLSAAQSLLDYVLGRNPTGYSYVTGYGHKTPMHIHHRASQADGIVQPVPGFLAGGPNLDRPEDCESEGKHYPVGREAIARAYLDDWCSYSTNEVTINWNAPLVYVSGALQAWVR